MKATFIDLHNDAWPTKDQLVVLPRPSQRVVDDVLHDRLVPGPGCLGDLGACHDGRRLVVVAPPLEGRKELADELHLEQGCVLHDVGGVPAPGAEEREVELAHRSLEGQLSVAGLAAGRLGDQADADEGAPKLRVCSEAVRPYDASDTPWQGVERGRPLGRGVSCRS